VKIQQLADRLAEHGLLVGGQPSFPDVEVTGVTDDSRNVQTGALFCAVRGTAMDGHAFTSRAAEAGAAAILAADPVEVGVPVIKTTDSRRASAVAASAVLGDPAKSLRTVGVTGTNGKSTTVAIIQHLLNENGDVGALGTLGGFDGAGEALYREGLTTSGATALHENFAELRNRGCKTVAMEASSHALDQNRLYGMTFAATVFTNLTHDHLDYHTTFEAYRRAKYMLADLASADSVQVVNSEDSAWSQLPMPAAGKRITFGNGGDLCVDPVGFDASPAGSSGTIRYDDQEYPFSIPHLGSFNVQNALAAVAVGIGLGHGVSSLLDRLRTAPQVSGRMERLSVDPLIIRDYAHTPDALERAIAAARPLTQKRLIVMFGCGGDRDTNKRSAMGRIGARDSDLAIVTSDNPRTEDPEKILNDIAEGIEGQAYMRVVDRHEAIERAVGMMESGDCLLLAGKGHETYQVLGTKKVPFDEKNIVASLLRGNQ
jgi:UDP-N-acetylmuramoyl-L-alanyl-D-glutamate--2,6-diaminopimelate ligase